MNTILVIAGNPREFKDWAKSTISKLEDPKGYIHNIYSGELFITNNGNITDHYINIGTVESLRGLRANSVIFIGTYLERSDIKDINELSTIITKVGS